MKRLRIPLALSVVVVTGATIATVVNCGHGESPRVDASSSCQVSCVPDGSGGSDANCPFPTCATGSNLDMCPAGCIPEPVV